MAKLKFTIVTPERTVLTEQVDFLTCQTTMGEITILPGHVPLIASLQAGELVAKIGNETEHMAVSGGFVEVRPNNEIVILADTAEKSAEIDIARAEEAKKRAVEAMKSAETISQEEYAVLAANFQKSLARLKVSRRKGRRFGNPLESNSNENFKA